MKKKIRKIEEPNHAEFIGFMLTNYDYKHDYLRIDRDLTLKLKEEEERAAYLNSENFN